MNGKKSFVLRITVVATLGGLLFGYDTAVISGTVNALNKVFILKQNFTTNTANWWLGFTVASALIGCVIGAMSGGIISHKTGRKKGLMLAALLFAVSAFGSSVPETGIETFGFPEYYSWFAFITYRIIGGIGVGLASMLSPMYISEIAPAQLRGRLVSINQFAIVLGVFLSYLVNYTIASLGNEQWLINAGWRWMFGVESIPALVFFFLLFTVPESPRWLVLKNRETEAIPIFQKIANRSDINKILENIKRSTTIKTDATILQKNKVIILGAGLAFFQQFVGINVVLYYAPEIFRNMGLSGNMVFSQAVIIGFVNIIFTLLAIYMVDRYGRKPLQIIGSAGMFVAMIALGTSFFFKKMGLGALVSILLYVAAFAMSWGPVTWVLISEIFPNKIRGQAMSVSVATTWISNFIVSQTFPVIDKNPFLVLNFNHGFSYWFYGIMALFSAIFVWKFIPETKNKSLEELEQLWIKKNT